MTGNAKGRTSVSGLINVLLEEDDMKKEIEERLSCLIGLRLYKMGRASNLLWVSFGNGFDILESNGKERAIGEFALNIQSCWRVTQQTKIIVAYRDIYYPSRTWVGDMGLFDWDVQGMNRCDERIAEIINRMNKENFLLVESIEADEVGGVTISFTSGCKLEIFPDNSTDTEYWRFFSKLEKDKHFVVTDKGIES